MRARTTHALVLLRDLDEAELEDALEEPGAALLQLEKRRLAEGAELVLGPAAGVVEHEAARLAVELFLVEELRDAHRLERAPRRVREQERQALGLQRGHVQLVRDVHESFDVVPGDCAHEARREGGRVSARV